MQRAVEEPLEPRGERAVRDVRQLQRLLVEALQHELVGRGATEGESPRQHAEEDQSEGVEVAPPVERVHHELLGAHVLRGADGEAQSGDVGTLSFGGPLGDVEVHDLGHVSFVGASTHHDVPRLQIAVDDAQAVCGAQRPGDLDGQVHGPLHGKGSLPLQQILQFLAVDVLHGQEPEVLVGFGEVVDGADVRMVDPRRVPGAAREPCDGFLVADQGRPQHLDRVPAPDLQMLAEVDGAHGPLPDVVQDTVPASQDRSDQGVAPSSAPFRGRRAQVIRHPRRSGGRSGGRPLLEPARSAGDPGPLPGRGSPVDCAR